MAGAQKKTANEIVNDIAAKAGNIPSVDDLIKITSYGDVEGGFDRPEYPDRHYILIDWSSNEEARRQIRVIQQRLRSGYVRDETHPMSNDFTVLMYTSVAEHNKRKRAMSEFADNDPGVTGVAVDKRTVQPTGEVAEALAELGKMNSAEAAVEDGI